MSVNKAIILGFVGKEPETRIFANGDAVTNFSIATSERYKDKSGEMKEITTWHNIAAFGKLSEICSQIVHKGSLVYVEGKIVTRKWTDKAGIERYITEIKGDVVQVLNKVEGGKEVESSKEVEAVSTHASDMLNSMDDEVPF
jgi:single-strand DNA-binding protein